jgi:hypothetical protein
MDNYQIEMEKLELEMLMNEFEIGVRNGQAFSEDFFERLCHQREWETYRNWRRRNDRVNTVVLEQANHSVARTNTSHGFFNWVFNSLFYFGLLLFLLMVFLEA